MFPHNRWHGVALPRDRGSARTVPAPSLLPYTKLRKTPFRSEIPQRSSHVSACEISMRNNFTSHILTQYPTQHATGADLCEISTPREDAFGRHAPRTARVLRAPGRRAKTCYMPNPIARVACPFRRGARVGHSVSRLGTVVTHPFQVHGFRFKGVISSSRLGWEMFFKKSLLLQLTLRRRHDTLFAVLYQTGSH